MPLGFCLSHYVWSLWAIFMSKNPEVEFDAIEFSYERLKNTKKLENSWSDSELDIFICF